MHLRHRRVPADEHRRASRCASKAGLLTTVAWKLGEHDRLTRSRAARFIAGAAVQWLRDGLGLIKKAADIEELAREVKDTGEVVFVPALAGLGAPHWRPEARGSVRGHRPLHHRGAPGPRGAGGHRAADLRPRARRCGSDSGEHIPVVQGRRRRGGERPADAVPGGHPRRSGGAARGISRPPAWARRSWPAWAPGVWSEPEEIRRVLEGGQDLQAEDGRSSRAQRPGQVEAGGGTGVGILPMARDKTKLGDAEVQGWLKAHPGGRWRAG